MSLPNPAPSPNETFSQTYLATILPAVPIPPGMTQADVRASVLVILNVLRPVTPTETLLAGLYIATLFAGIESLRRAEVPSLSPALACRLRSSGLSAIRLMLTLGHRLEKARGDQPGAKLPGVEALSATLTAEAARRFNPAPQYSAAPGQPDRKPPGPPAGATHPGAPAQPAGPHAANGSTEPHAPVAPGAVAAAAQQPRPPATRPVVTPAPGLPACSPSASRRERKAARYAMRHAMKLAALAASADASPVPGAPPPRE